MKNQKKQKTKNISNTKGYIFHVSTHLNSKITILFSG